MNGKQYILSIRTHTTNACNVSVLVPLKLGITHNVIIIVIDFSAFKIIKK